MQPHGRPRDALLATLTLVAAACGHEDTGGSPAQAGAAGHEDTGGSPAQAGAAGQAGSAGRAAASTVGGGAGNSGAAGAGVGGFSCYDDPIYKSYDACMTPEVAQPCTGVQLGSGGSNAGGAGAAGEAGNGGGNAGGGAGGAGVSVVATPETCGSIISVGFYDHCGGLGTCTYGNFVEVRDGLCCYRVKTTTCCGRPLHVHGVARVAALVASGAWATM